MMGEIWFYGNIDRELSDWASSVGDRSGVGTRRSNGMIDVLWWRGRIRDSISKIRMLWMRVRSSETRDLCF